MQIKQRRSKQDPERTSPSHPEGRSQSDGEGAASINLARTKKLSRTSPSPLDSSRLSRRESEGVSERVPKSCWICLFSVILALGLMHSAAYAQPAGGFFQQGATPGANSAANNTQQNIFSGGQPNTSAATTPEAKSALDAQAAEEEAKLESKSSSVTSSASSWAKSLINAIRGAGLMVFPILACSVLLVMFVLERSIALRRSRVIPKHFTKLFIEELEDGQLKPLEALQLCEENKSPISEVFAAAVKKWNKPSVEVEQAVIDSGERVANGLRRYLRLFNGIATIAPLLGLLGTVLGMIEAFGEIASSSAAMGRPEVLAKGISQALLTTAGGLSVAIPAFIAYMYFTSRVDRLIIGIDELGQQVVGAIASDAWKSKSKSKSKQTSKAA